MLRSAASKVMWVGRATVFMVGLAVILAVVLGAATTALGATGGNFILGQPNSADAPTTLTWTGNTDVTKSALVLKNIRGGFPLQLQAGDGIAPMKVNSGAKVAKLNADKVDGQSLHCPSGTLFHEGGCIETTKRASATWVAANSDCHDEGKRLPSAVELQTFGDRSGHDFSDYEHTLVIDLDDGFWVHQYAPQSGAPRYYPTSTSVDYRCVVPVS